MVSLVFILTSIIGALLPYCLTRYFILDAIKASALPSLIIGIVCYLIPDLLPEPFQTDVQFVFYGASFVGMVSSKIFPRWIQVIVSAFIFAILYKNASAFFNGYGGALGTAACISVIAVYGITRLRDQRKRKRN